MFACVQMTISKVEDYASLSNKQATLNTSTDGNKQIGAQLKNVSEWCEDASITPDFLKRHGMKETSNEDAGAQAMQVSLYAYAKVMRKRMCDVVPQMVHSALVSGVADRLQPEMLSAMSAERLQAGAVDTASVAKRRAAAELRLKNFTAAMEQLSTIAVSPAHVA